MTSIATGIAAEESAAKPVADNRNGGPRAFLHRMHTIAGILVAPLLVIAAVTGIGYALSPSIEKIVYSEETTATSTLPPRSLQQQVEAARKLHPDLPVDAVQTYDESGRNTHVLFADSSLPSKSYRRVVFVDPGDLSIKGDTIQYGSAAALPVRTWISEGHKRLWSGNNIGRLYSETAAAWMGALTLAGLWLWWDRSRRGRNKGTSKRAHHMSRHARVGVWLSIGLLFLTATGLTWSWVAGSGIKQVREAMDWFAPKPNTAITAAATPGTGATDAHAGHGASASAAPVEVWNQADTVNRVARDSGLVGKIELTPPADGGAWVAKEARQEWRLGMETVAVDGSNGDIVDRVAFADWPLAAKLTEWTINAHMGILFGWVNQLILVAVGIGLIAIIIRGYAMWFGRGRGRRPGRLPLPTKWRDIRPSVAAAIIVALVAYSVIAPLFGITLVLFAVADWVWRKVRGARSVKEAAVG